MIEHPNSEVARAIRTEHDGLPHAEQVFAGMGGSKLQMHTEQFRRQGVTTFGPPALTQRWYRALLAEAREQITQSSWLLSSSCQQGEIQQNNRRAHLSETARRYLASEAVFSILRRVTSKALAPAWSASCYTQYIGPGEHMGEHCDKPDACTYNILTYLDARWPEASLPSSGLSLFVFRGDNSNTGIAAKISAQSNRVVLLYGSRHSHMRPALQKGESLLLLAGCFRCL